jgi:ribosomal protein S18 acetylase RimI-like enzyme
MTGPITTRPARPGDAASMAILVDIAGHGLPAYFWSSAVARGEAYSVLEVGRERARRDEGSFSWRNATMAEIDGAIAGMLVGYRQPDSPEFTDPEDYDPVVRPLIELEPLSRASWYINVLASFAEFRGRGVGTALLGEAETIARRTAARALSLIVEDVNSGAMRLYRRHGFNEVARRTFHPFPQCHPVQNWILMERVL